MRIIIGGDMLSVIFLVTIACFFGITLYSTRLDWRLSLNVKCVLTIWPPIEDFLPDTRKAMRSCMTRVRGTCLIRLSGDPFIDGTCASRSVNALGVLCPPRCSGFWAVLCKFMNGPFCFDSPLPPSRHFGSNWSPIILWASKQHRICQHKWAV